MKHALRCLKKEPKNKYQDTLAHFNIEELNLYLVSLKMCMAIIKSYLNSTQSQLLPHNAHSCLQPKVTKHIFSSS